MLACGLLQFLQFSADGPGHQLDGQLLPALITPDDLQLAVGHDHAIDQQLRQTALLDREEPVMAMAQGSKVVKWLDVPGGPVASGQAVFVSGHLGRSGAGRPDGD